jgi:hypothetical protein
MTAKEAQKGLEAADKMALSMNWEKAPKYVKQAYQYLVRLFVKEGAKE